MLRTLVATTAAGLIALGAVAANAGETPAPEGAEVYFIGLEDGATLSNPVTIRFGARGIGIAPAGVDRENTGHHHLIINEAIEGEELSESIPADEQHVHFGGGQTEVTLDLPAGTHTLQLVMADMNHIPHNPPIMSERITVTVK
ncbi:MAG: DUF4399 domain-containing protein [Pseudomonadota bacterium]